METPEPGGRDECGRLITWSIILSMSTYSHYQALLSVEIDSVPGGILQRHINVSSGEPCSYARTQDPFL